MEEKKKLAGIAFKTRKGNQYFYDDNTGMVFPCPDVMLEILERFQNQSKLEITDILSSKYSSKEITQYYDLIEKWVKTHGSFYYEERDTSPLSPPTETEIVSHLENHGFKQLILNITENCNLRCEYCLFSSQYHFERTHNNKKMSFAVAKKAIDYYYQSASKVKERIPYRTPIITFYGGEPLLEFPLIKEVIEYGRKKFGSDVFFNMTTNAVLLTEEVLDYLFSQQVSISISLDGPEKEHDRVRVDTAGKGSFKRVMDNLKLLKEKYPVYPFNLILSTYDWGTDLTEVRKFFEKNKDMLPFVARASLANSSFTDYYDRFSQEEIDAFFSRFNQLEEEYFNDITKNPDRIPGYLDSLVGQASRLLMVRARIYDRRKSLMPFSGSCIPGDKLSVSPTGEYHLCEKINDHFPIGNIHDGLDFSKIKDIVTRFRETVLDQCDHCPVTRLCMSCYVSFAGEGEFSKVPSDVCKHKEEDSKKRLSFAYSIMEENPNAYEEIMNKYYKEFSWLE